MSPALPKTWYYVYLLKSELSKWIHIGCTGDLRKRLMEHNRGKVFTTKKMLPLELIYFEAYRSKEQAHRREKCLKEYGSALAKQSRGLDLKRKEGRGEK